MGAFLFYPALLNIKGKECIVIGGGKVAERKILSLLKYGAKVKVISPSLTEKLKKVKEEGKIIHINRKYKEGDLVGAFIVIAATSDSLINKKIASEAPFLVNVVDLPEIANLIVPSIVTRGPLTFAISTSGASPALAKAIKKELKIFYNNEFSKYLAFVKKTRKQLISKIEDKKLRNAILQAFASYEIIQILRNRGYKEAKGIALKKIKDLMDRV
ncbi:MAG: bifunctional precorrin-2 dehydrogenase/sirohydrochlorin ferrochelatase [Thermodesulfovibrionales bacterium]|nr:bifunctional precorrin-2 dehydrogenase/sirohydrochlorin ferrochelatase [Thermodesulfovibrionales bacterium]